ncbi:MAG: biosynthetic peptidoglycan transglycosylase, partial [Cyanobacteria bacterium J06559_1]
MANLFSQLKQWSTRRGRNKPPGKPTARTKQSIRTGGRRTQATGSRATAANSPTAIPGSFPNAKPNTKYLVGRKPPYKKIRFWLLLLLGAGIAGPGTRLYLLYSNLQEQVPDVRKALTYERSGTITLKASDGKVLQKVGPTAQESLNYDEIPQVMVQAFIAAEDRRFREHNGVDYRSIARATFANVSSGGVVEGASTITQQLARIT